MREKVDIPPKPGTESVFGPSSTPTAATRHAFAVGEYTVLTEEWGRDELVNVGVGSVGCVHGFCAKSVVGVILRSYSSVGRAQC